MTASSPGFDFSAVVVGAGAVGLATGFALARCGLAVAVLERERAIGRGISARSSQVIHAGLYYPTGSLKARLCVEGRRQLYTFLERHGVAHRRCGKLLVATEPAEIPHLEAIERQARLNGVEDVALLSAEQARRLEPALRVVLALSSPQTGVFDSHAYMLALKSEIEARGGLVVPATPFESATPLAGGGFKIRIGGQEPASLTCQSLVIASGLGAQDAAARIEGYPTNAIPTLHYGKGVYFALVGRAPFKRLIYPLPASGQIGGNLAGSALGVHYLFDLGGQARFGPDLSFVEGEDYGVDPARAEEFSAAIRRYWPDLPDGALSPDYAGIRPKLHGPGEIQPDFRIDDAGVHGIEGLVTLFGIESPGLTSALAIGDAVASRLGLSAVTT